MRISNVIKALARHYVLLYDTSIYYAYELSQNYNVSDQARTFPAFDTRYNPVLQAKEILNPKISKDIAERTEAKLFSDNS